MNNTKMDPAEIFAFFDIDNNGTISSSEFQDLAYAAGIPLDDDTAATTYRHIALTNPEGLILTEFQSWWNGNSTSSQAPISRIIRARLLANNLGRSLTEVSTSSSFWKNGDEKVNSISVGMKIGEIPNNVPAMAVKVALLPSTSTLKNPTLSLVLNIEDGVSDFSLGTAIGTIQTMLDAASSAIPGAENINIHVADPVDGQLIIQATIKDLSMLPTGPPVPLNVCEVVQTFECAISCSQCFETLFGVDSKVQVFGEMFNVDVSLKVNVLKKGIRLLKHMKMHMDRLHGVQWYHPMQALMDTTSKCVLMFVTFVSGIHIISTRYLHLISTYISRL